MKKNLIIIGGGFAGITLAKKLLKTARDRFSITLVDKNDYQLFYPAFFKALVSKKNLSEIFNVVAIKFERIFSKSDIKIVKREVKNVFPAQNKILLKEAGRNKGQNRLDYDYLVVAAGRETKVPGLTFQSFEDVLRLKERMENLFKNAEKNSVIEIEVVGAGATGCGLVGFLSEYACELSVKHKYSKNPAKLKIVDSHDCLLVGCSGWLQEKVSQSLKKMGVEIVTRTRFDPAKETAPVVVWAVGAEPVRFFDGEITEHLRLRGQSNVLVLEAVTAQSAIHRAKYISRALMRLLDKKELKPYGSNKDYNIVELGEKYAFADLGFIKLKGRMARWAHELALVRYLISVMGISKAVNWFKKYRGLLL